MSGLDWSLLRSFLAVVEAGSLSGAAILTGATQPTLSRHIRELEATLGVSLFVRTARGLDPTEAALGLVDDARSMGAAAEALALKAHGRSARLTGTVRITASVVVANLVLPTILAALRIAEPSIQIELVASDLNQNLLRRDADLAIRMTDPVQQALVARKIGETPLGLFGTRALLDRVGRPTTFRDAVAVGILGFDRNDAILRALAARRLPMTREDFPVRCDDQLVFWHLMLAGAGLGFAQTLLAGREPDLEQVDIGMTMPALPIWFVMHEDVRASPRLRRVVDFLGSALANVFGAR